MSDKDTRERFFEERFLLADVKPDVILRMPFLIMNNADIDFQAWDLQWRSYITGDILPTTRQIKLIGKKEFAVAALDPKHETFVIHIAAFSEDLGDKMHPSKKTQITQLKADEALTKVPSKYTNFTDVFLPKLAAELPKYTGINNHSIKLVDD